ncbi:MAG: class I SAM-dependent methyltransferase [Lachnospiraceae bacterium]|jgi:SAM-dependent methyltransferase|nr:class I SAM-dependent methyltransferase [Lachnospiraceae bacterium]
MDAYTGFAEVYDTFMDNVPYEEWAGYLVSLLKEYDVEDGLVCELGCGTGKMTELLENAGYDMIGIDASFEMLDIANQNRNKSGNILYLCQDMREMELYGTVKAVVSICDSINYLLSEEDLLTTFSLVNNYLDPGGVFIFDMNTEYKYRELLGERTICENRKSCSFIWENYYDEEERINEYDLTLFVKEQEDLFRRFEEIHYQRSYRIDTVKQILAESGLYVEAVYDAMTHEAPTAKSERVYFIAREIQK